jgi:pyrroline-5-carboxylate reductase
MAGAILNRVSLPKESVLVCDNDQKKLVFWAKEGFSVTNDIEKVGQVCEYVLLSIKPQSFEEVSKSLKNINSKAIISIMAGITIEKLAKILPSVARVMPNMPCIKGKGISAITYFNFDDGGKIFVNKIFKSVGKISEIPEEKMNAITALSGSGPAYVFFFLDVLTEAGVEFGLTKKEAFNFSKITFAESAKMAKISLKEQISNVASKGGTTEAAMKSFADDNVKNFIKKGIKSAKNRADELSKL